MTRRLPALPRTPYRDRVLGHWLGHWLSHMLSHSCRSQRQALHSRRFVDLSRCLNPCAPLHGHPLRRESAF